MSTRGASATRGLIAAAVATLLAGLSHTIGGGAAPLGVGSLIAFAFAALICVALAGKRLALWRLSLSVALSQLAFHGLFAVTGGAAPVASGVAAHHESAAVLMDRLPPMDAAMGAGHDGAGMAVAHVGAAILTIAALHRGEHAVRAVLQAAVRVITSVVRVVRPLSPPSMARLTARAVVTLPRDLEVVLSSMRHRGPPRALPLA
ncbi:MAG: hypothetical protein ABWX82_15040 [Leifsonia sp.]